MSDGLVDAARSTEFLMVEGERMISYALGCINIYISSAKAAAKCHTGKTTVMVNHLLGCEYCTAEVKKKARVHKRGDSGSGSATDPEIIPTLASSSSKGTGKRQMEETGQMKKRQKSFTVVAAKALAFSPMKQVVFEDQLLRACISAGWSFNSVMDTEVRKLFTMFIPGATLPDRKKLAGSILSREVVRVEGCVQEASKGHYATLQADGWKDISKKHLIAFMVTANRQVCNPGLIG